MRPATLLKLITAADALRRPERLEGLLQACEADACSRPGRDAYPAADYLREAFAVVKKVDAGAVARSVMSRQDAGGIERPDAIAAGLHAARLTALRAWKRKAGVPQAMLQVGLRPDASAKPSP